MKTDCHHGHNIQFVPEENKEDLPVSSFSANSLGTNEAAFRRDIMTIEEVLAIEEKQIFERKSIFIKNK